MSPRPAPPRPPSGAPARLAPPPHRPRWAGDEPRPRPAPAPGIWIASGSRRPPERSATGPACPETSDRRVRGRLWVPDVAGPRRAVSQRAQSRAPSHPRPHPQPCPAHLRLLRGLPRPTQNSVSARRGRRRRPSGGSRPQLKSRLAEPSHACARPSLLRDPHPDATPTLLPSRPAPPTPQRPPRSGVLGTSPPTIHARSWGGRRGADPRSREWCPV